MCWILVKQAGNKVNVEAMDKAQLHNEDGYGVAWHENGYVNTYKTFDYEQFKGVCTALEKHTLVIHLRYATKGGTNYGNIHPFDIPSGVMFHNGTMFKAPSTYTKSDSQGLADLLSQCDFEAIGDVMPLVKPYVDDKINRLVFFEDSGEITIVNEELGIKDSNGDWYSNDYHLKEEGWCRGGKCVTPKVEYKKKEKKKPTAKIAKVFVYGTLKKGGRNNRILKDAVYLGKAKTVSSWTMIGNGFSFPYVLEENTTLGSKIHGEVYNVDASELARLDMLEGVPTHYKQVPIKVAYETGYELEDVIMYVKANFDGTYTADMDLITEWEV